jgi:hypothetical protein
MHVAAVFHFLVENIDFSMKKSTLNSMPSSVLLICVLHSLYSWEAINYLM